jgi:3-deoxy-D-manno-octulosonic-acid transferase
MQFLYNLSIYLYSISIRIAAFFDPKAHLWIKGRKKIFTQIAEKINPEDEIVWFHSASLGEFEQGRPVIESFRENFPQYKILLTFFSPSGYEIRKDYEKADYIFYLPLDTKSNAKKFIRLIQPKIAIFIKYEFWYNYLKVLHQNNIPTFFISSIFRQQQHFFKWFGAWFRKRLMQVSYFFVQNDESVSLLNSIGVNGVIKSGDTRFDRVYKIAVQTKQFPLVEIFTKNNKVLLAGSTWPIDEEIFPQLLQKIDDLKIIIAPHEVNHERIKSLKNKFDRSKTILFSEANEVQMKKASVLIVDGVGFLSHLYQYCTFAYIGGGFGSGIHNILEAATFGKPIVLGPNHLKFAEAVDLIRLNGAFGIQKKEDLINVSEQLLTQKTVLQSATIVCKDYVKENRGATAIILKKIEEFL